VGCSPKVGWSNVGHVGQRQPHVTDYLVCGASPPDSVSDGRSKLRWPSPISTNELSLVTHKADELRHTVLAPRHRPWFGGRDYCARGGVGHLGALRFVKDSSNDRVVDSMRRASVFAYLSLYGGFGLTALEAMACGVPVSSIPKVVGYAALGTTKRWQRRSDRVREQRNCGRRESPRVEGLT
jgi:glycosyltransferase involved in cell wall biosynthesis